MSELVLPFAVMVLTVTVMLCLVRVFRKWLALRETLDREMREDSAGAPRPPLGAAAE